MKTERFDLHQHITDKIVSAIERGVGEFRVPWRSAAGSSMRPVNVGSKKPYRGVNILSLWATAEDMGFDSGIWGTYRQRAEVGAQVRKGEKVAFVVFYKNNGGSTNADPLTTTAISRLSDGFSRALQRSLPSSKSITLSSPIQRPRTLSSPTKEPSS